MAENDPTPPPRDSSDGMLNRGNREGPGADNGLPGDVSELSRLRNELSRLRANRLEFLGALSHEIRTPLNAVLGYAHMLGQSDRLSDWERDRLDIIRRSGEQLLMLMGDLLDLARIEEGRYRLEPVPVRLKSLLDQVSAMLKSSLNEHEVQLRIDYSPGVPNSAAVDVKVLRQALLNVLSAMIRMMGGDILSLRVETVGAPTQLRFVFTEDGEGQALADLLRQLLAGEIKETTKTPPGAGFGFVVGTRLLEILGADFDLDVAAGNRVTFSVHLEVEPCADVPEDLPKRRTRELPRMTDGMQVHGDVLIVDDNPESRRLMRDLLERVGFVVLEADNGRSAQRILRESLVDAVLTDLVMPFMDGYELVAWIKSRADGADLPVFAITASVLPTDHHDPRGELFQAFLRKPIDEGELFDLMATVFPELAEEEAPGASDDTGRGDGMVRELPERFDSADDYLVALRSAALVGDIGALRDLAAMGSELFPELESFNAGLRKAARSFQADRITEMVEREMNKDGTPS